MTKAPSWLNQVVITSGLFCLLIFLGYQLWQYWPTMLLKSIHWQRAMNNELSELLAQAKENNLTAGFYLAGISFLYGVLHSVGPGHGKIIVTTFMATHPTKVKHGLMITFISAMLQAVVAIGLVTAFVLIFQHSMKMVTAKANELVSLSFLAMTGVGVYLIWRAILALRNQLKPAHNCEHSGCSCGHQHVPTAAAINQATHWRTYAGIVISIGIRPCSGAILVLLFSTMLNTYLLGILSALLMALGTAITTSCIALLTLSGKRFISRYLALGESQTLGFAKTALQFLGGSILALIGLVLYHNQSAAVVPVLFS